jgi:hypothetical protein
VEARRFGLDEQAARTAAQARAPGNSSLSERAKRTSSKNFSEAGDDVRPGHHSRDLFGSFLDPAKNERGSAEISIDVQDEPRSPKENATRTSCG